MSIVCLELYDEDKDSKLHRQETMYVPLFNHSKIAHHYFSIDKCYHMLHLGWHWKI
jgi:hypothetical protein